MYDRIDTMYWSLLYILVSLEKYELVYFSDESHEAWLESTQKKNSTIVRFKCDNFDLANQVEHDIIEMQPLIQQLMKRSFQRIPAFFNVYISKQEPVDDWKLTTEDMRVAAPIKTTFFANDNVEEQRNFLIHYIGLQEEDLKSLQTLQGEDPLNLRRRLAVLLESRKKQRERITHYAQPVITKALITIQIAMFCILEWNGGSMNTATLIHFGAKYNPLILQGEWWRFFTPMFLHIGILHLLMNTVALYYIGSQVERIIGNGRFLFLYLLAGFSGSVFSFIVSNSVSAGASGAIFGCFSVLLYIAFTYSKIFPKAVMQNVITLIGINLVFGFIVPGIDNAGHIGGLVGGLLGAVIVHVPKQASSVWKRGAAIIFSIVVLGGLLWYGYHR